MKPIPAVFVALASVALSIVAALAFAPRVEPSAPLQAASPRLAELEARIDALERRPATVRAELPEDGAPRSPVAPAGDAPQLADLVRRLEQLEGGRPPSESPRPQRTPEQEARLRAQQDAERAEGIATATSIILDPSASVEAKVEAHRELRRVENAYSPEMVNELLRLATLDPNPDVRADTWTSFDGTTVVPELVQPLIHALVNDPDERPRNEASETLGNYATHPGVLDALRHAARHDPSPVVRQKALRTLREVDPDYKGPPR